LVEVLLCFHSSAPAARTLLRKDRLRLTVTPPWYLQISAKIAAVLEEKVHYTVDEQSQSVVLTERGFSDVEKILNVEDLFNPRDPWSPYIINALKAKSLFKKDVQYVKKGNEIMIVDEFTGRVLEGRRWSNGLHQSVEAKEAISPSAETQTIASVTYQSFFRQFPKLSGMSGTASTEAGEFGDIYNLQVVSIPTALPIARRDNDDVCFRTQQGKWEAIMGDIARRHTKGQPILIGTTSIQASEQLDKLLNEYNVPHELLNAKPENVERENEIIAQVRRPASLPTLVAIERRAWIDHL
jgi:preprotein translocase subunit SecA